MLVFRSILAMLCALTLNAQGTKIQVVATTDISGRILPRDPFTLQPANQGWAKVTTLIRGLKAKNPNTLLVDCGNSLAGDPLNYVRSRLAKDQPEPSIAVMNLLGYNAMAVGDRDFDFGFPNLRDTEDKAQFPFLCANAVFTATGKGAFTPYVKLEVAGIQVAILGLTFASLPQTTDAAKIEGLKFLDPVETARTMIPRLRNTEKVDLVIVAIHGIAGKGCSTLGDSPVQCLAERVPGIDLILAGHGNHPLAAKVAGVPVIQGDQGGRALGVADLTLTRTRTRNRLAWNVETCDLRLEQPTADTVQDPQVLGLTAPLRTKTEAYLDTFATNLGTDLDGRWSRMEGSALVQLLHTVMRKAVGAQITAVASPGSRIFIPKGPTSVRQFYALAPTEDRVARIQITGAQLRQYLENAARFYNYGFQPDLYNREFGPQNYDMLSGVEYALDISRTLGSRISNLRYQGDAVRGDQVFTLAITTSRLAGAGGYMEAMGFKGRAEAISPNSLRNQLLEYVLARPSLSVSVVDNWRTVPYLDRERVLAQQP